MFVAQVRRCLARTGKLWTGLSTDPLQASHLGARSRICLSSYLGYSEEKVRDYYILDEKYNMTGGWSAGCDKHVYALICVLKVNKYYFGEQFELLITKHVTPN
jgi:hypothetical protein